MKKIIYRSIYLIMLLPLLQCNSSKPGINKINHIIIIYLENHSFDNLYGQFKNANGLNNASGKEMQVSADGTPYKYLPMPKDLPFAIDTTLPNQPFNMDKYIGGLGGYYPDLKHRYPDERNQVDEGKMDKFVQKNYTSSLGLAMGYFPTDSLPLASFAKQYVLCDNFFHGAIGGSFLNHIFMISDSVPRDTAADSNAIKKGTVTPDYYVVNTAYSNNKPDFRLNESLKGGVVIPDQTMPTIGDNLTDKQISWAWYAGGWDDAMNGHPSKYFAFHHQPFVYFEKYNDNHAATKNKYLKDENDFLQVLNTDSLPSVCFIKPSDSLSEHPGYDASDKISLLAGEKHTVDLINAIRNSKYWKDAVIIITYDENGGFWDHVPPPTDKTHADRWGPGTRVPTIVVSPFAKQGYVDHTYYETSSILSLIEHRYDLKPLGKRDANADYFLNAFDF